MWSEAASHKKMNTVQLHVHEVTQIVKFIETEIRMWLTGAGKGGKEDLLISTEFQIFKMKKFWRSVPNNVNTCNTTELYT